MGIVSRIKTKVKNKMVKAANTVANGISKAAQLSEEQIASIEAKKKAYLAQKPDVNSEENKKLVERMLGTLGTEVYHAYLSELNTIYHPITTVPANYSAQNRIAYFDITKWVLDVEENYIDKLVNVYHVLSNEDCNVALIFNQTMSGCNVTMAIVNNGEDNDPKIVASYKDRIKEAVAGNFPGAVIVDNEKRGIPECLKNFDDLSNDKLKNVASVTNIATEKSEKFISQSIEKLLDGVVPQNKNQEYTFILLATPSLETITKKSRLSEIYTALAPFASWQTNFTYVEAENKSSSFNAGVNFGVNAGVSYGIGAASTLSNAVSHTHATTHTDTAGDSVGGKIGPVGASGQYSHSYGRTNSDTQTNGTANSNMTNNGAFAGVNFGVNFNRSSNVSVSVGKNEGITQSYTNHQIKHTLEILEMQMKRLEQCSALGMWEFASYVISDDYNTANNAAHMYLALTQGDESFVSQSAVNLWHAGKSPEDAKILLREIGYLQHPVFCLRDDLDPDWLMYPTTVDATTVVSGRELAHAFNLPRKSVAGFPVIECAEFGRNVVTYDSKNEEERKISLGNIFHMNHEESTEVTLSVKSLASHTFITGSTGVGKSNTIYSIINDIRKKGVSFLVIEPAKGEYKHIFGNRKDVSVYGTNPELSELLRINPFSFPKGIHILEHLDRLVEIFNVCWPMYAAMPAVLKSAIEKSYEDCGWDLTESCNEYDDSFYPQFSDVARNIKQIIDSSEYDSENKGAYKGSLLTRLQSLTNGINGLIFTENEIPLEKMFDENVIVDLSRVGSSETKSMIMGMLVLKLQEYRMTKGEMNAPLNHVTVLEEAHNLLKRTSTEQVSEGANLTGKSVEMISNAIAEMRTYGEGFIIADQSPGLLDMSAIRNTNTKIIMRLPDITDRELVGRAANLNDDQIEELAKLPCGVGAVYQNEWIQPVLCKVHKHDIKEASYEYKRERRTADEVKSDDMVKIAELLSNGTKLSREAVLTDIIPSLSENHISASVKVSIIKNLENPHGEPRMTKLAPVMSALFPRVKKAVISAYKDNPNACEWTNCAEEALLNNLICVINDKTRRDIIQAVITDYIFNELGNIADLEKWSKNGGLR